MYLYLYNVVQDLNINNRVKKKLLSNNLNIKSELSVCDLVGAGTTSKHESQPQSVFIYLSPFLYCYLWYL